MLERDGPSTPRRTPSLDPVFGIIGLSMQCKKRHKYMRLENNKTGFNSIDCNGGCPGGSVVKNLPVTAEDTGLIPGSGRSSREGNGNPLQNSCWEIFWTEEPGGPQSKGLQRVGHG